MSCSELCLTRKKLSRRQKLVTISVVVVALVALLSLVGVLVSKGRENERLVSKKNGGNEELGILSTLPSFPPTIAPSKQQDITSSRPSNTPTASVLPSAQPSDLSEFPSTKPSTAPSFQPSSQPTKSSTPSPSKEPSSNPILPSSLAPSERLPHSPLIASSLSRTIFYVVADAPYNYKEAVGLRKQVSSIPLDAEFLIHLGDVKHGGRSCTVSRLQLVSDILQKSHVPVFLVVGDNEFNDCKDPNSALNDWRQMFGNFDQKWNHSLNVVRPHDRTDSFYFVSKSTLFIGLNIVGGPVHNKTEWDERLNFSVNWTIGRIQEHTTGGQKAVHGVVVFAHANPGVIHSKFFNPLKVFIRDNLKNTIPILYMNGDVHKWLHEPVFYNQKSFSRIRLSGGVDDPPLRMAVDPKAFSNVAGAFQYERFWS